MRDRYYIRFEKVQKPYEKVCNEFNRRQSELRRQHYAQTGSYATTGGWGGIDKLKEWFLEHHNIVLSYNANGILKLGFASRADVTLFVLGNS